MSEKDLIEKSISEKGLREKLSQVEQQVTFLETINHSLQFKKDNLEKTQKELEIKNHNSDILSVEMQQENKLLKFIKNKLSNTPQQSKIDEKTEIINLFRRLKQMTFSLLSTLTKIEDAKLLAILEELESQEKIISLGETKEPICNVCSFRLLELRFSCPKCTCQSFEKDDLLEHFPCSNISRRADYKDDKCPQCKKALKALGVDYIISSNIHFCNQCNENFQSPLLSLVCRKCNTSQTIENTKWASCNAYRLIYVS